MKINHDNMIWYDIIIERYVYRNEKNLVCRLNSFCDKPGHHTYVIHTVHESTARHLNLFVDDRQNYTVNSWELWERCSCSSVCLVSACTCISLCVCVSCQCTISARERVCVSQQVQTVNTLTCLTHSAPEPLMGGLYCSWLVQPLKQAPGLQQRLGPKPRLHSPHQPSCLFSEALEETLDKAYQIQTVARLCYFTHRPPLNSASFSVIVFFLAQ